MKIIQQFEFGSADVLKVMQCEPPQFADGEVLIKGAYTSINFADIKNRTGAKAKGAFPITLGLDMVGTITESRSTQFQAGDRVIAFPKNGSYAELAVAHESLTYKIPDTLSFEQAAAMPTVSFLAAILVGKVGAVTEEDTVIIHSAAGGVGSMLVQLCKEKQCRKIIATVGSLEKLDYVKELGADVVCTYEDFVDTTLEATNQKGATIIFDSVAGNITADILRCLAPFGTLVQFGNSSGKKGTFSTSDVHSSCRSVKGFSLGTTRKLKPEIIRPFAEKMIDQFASQSLHLNIDRIFPLENVTQAHQYFEQRQHNGKILLKLNPEQYLHIKNTIL
ncbi:MAG: zinc-binding alcohol dehydrogenase family protein [Solibacillus sp.]|uniref:quinone oxidoreductase family protein n=1 Tax=Solibacillus sp. FSL H8-0523 TaxID=2954511 RepID=UPI0031018BF7